MNLLLLQLNNETKLSCKTVCFGLNIDEKCDESRDTDTQIIRTLWYVPLVSTVLHERAVHYQPA